MTTAAANLDFERAAALRDKLDSLTWVSEHLQRVSNASRHSFVYAVRGHDDVELWYLIHGGCVRAIVAAPQDERSQEEVAKRIQHVYGSGEAASVPVRVNEMDRVLLVDAWFRRRKEERDNTLEPAAVLKSCRFVNFSIAAQGMSPYTQ